MPAGVLIALAVGGTALNAYGQVKAGKAAKRAGDFNAAVSELQAEDALSRGKLDEARFRQGLKGIIGSQRAGFAGQNVDVGTGSAVDVQADTAFQGELDAQDIRLSAQREAWGYTTQAQSYRMTGQAAQTAGYLNAGATVLGGAASIYQAKYGFGPRNTQPSGTSTRVAPVNKARFSY